MIAPGWSRLEARDPRLKGWSNPYAVGPTGSTVTVTSAERCMTGRGMFQEPALLVCLRILTPEGHVYYHDRLLTRPSKFDLWSLSGLSTYVAELIGESPSPDALDELHKAVFDGHDLGGPDGLDRYKMGLKGAPQLDALTILKSHELLRLWRNPAAVPADQLRDMLDDAYRLGRQIGEADAPSAAARARASHAGVDRAAWHRPLKAWCEALIEDWPPGKRLSYAQLGQAIVDGWDDRPFEGEGPSKIDQLYLVRSVLPRLSLNLARAKS